ncbi:hypothetical protein FOA52_008504 [Chlamydomonas sp. UWO 241]|nr:hypothetical protein FOA52_008504 [Chlamydomonas sp. UWO 241]
MPPPSQWQWSGGPGHLPYGAPLAYGAPPPPPKGRGHAHGKPPHGHGPVGLAAAGGGVSKAQRKKQRRQQAPHGDAGPPSLQQLQSENKARTRRHYRGKGGAPMSVPRAPEHSVSYLFSTPHHSQGGLTPAASFATEEGAAGTGRYWKNAIPATIDTEAAEIGAAAGIDMFGSNAGLIRIGSGDHDAELGDVQPVQSTDEDSDPYGLELEDDGDGGGAGPSARHEAFVPQGVRKRMDDQGAYICQLEESNLKMREQIYLLEKQLEAALRRAGSGRADGSDSEGGLAGASDDADN